MSRMTPAFTKEFGDELKKHGIPPNQHFASLVDILQKHKMCYKAQLNPALFLTHVKNRGGLLLSPHNAHKNAASIKAAGADLSALTNAWCFELAHDGETRRVTFEKNERLIKRAGGLLAEISGDERYSSVGCGHTVGWCKHAQKGGKSSEKSLQQHDSKNIDIQKVCSDAQMKTMIYEGWEWNVVFFEVDIMFPLFASIAQKALNTRNHIANVVGELEVCVTLANMLKDTGMTDEPGWEQLAIENIESLCAPCAHYAATLLKYIRKYGGGADADLIHFVDNVAKQFSANVALGQSYWTALTNMEFADKTMHYPMVRTALMLANLTGGKVEDSVARLILPNQIKPISAKTGMVAALTAEKTLQDAWAIVHGCSSAEECIKPLGQLFVRLGLKLVNKEKLAREGKSYSWDDMKKLFLRGVSEVVQKPVEFPNWFDTEAEEDSAGDKDKDEKEKSSADTAKGSSMGPLMANLADHQDPAFVCNQAGFKVGDMVVMKGVEVNHESVYAIMSINTDGITLHQACSFAGTPDKKIVQLTKLIKSYSLTKREMPVVMNDPVVGLPVSFKTTAKRAEIFAALMEAFNKSSKRYADLYYVKDVGGDHVRTKQGVSFKAGTLVLVPAVPLINIIADPKEEGRGIDVGTFDGHRYIVGQTAKPATKGADWNPAETFVNPYFWVGKVKDKKAANMEAAKMVIKGIEVPVLKNNVDLGPHTKLDVFVKKVASGKKKLKDDDNDNDVSDKVAAKAKAKSDADPAQKKQKTK